MHDDDVPVTPEPWEPEPYWTEEDWERFMMENERLMDRYEQVWKDDPNRRWDDPLDLYYKVHYDLDLGEEPARPSPPRPPSAFGTSASHSFSAPLFTFCSSASGFGFNEAHLEQLRRGPGSKVKPDPQLGPPVDLLLAEFGQTRADVERAAQAHLEIRESGIQEFGRQRQAAVAEVDDADDRRGEIEDIEGFLLANAHIEVVPRRGLAAIPRLAQGAGPPEQRLAAGGWPLLRPPCRPRC